MTSARAYRLPPHVRPKRYNVSLRAKPTSNDFSGQVEILLDVQKSTQVIELHARGLDLSNGVLTSGGATLPVKAQLFAEEQMARLSLDRAIGPGPATLTIDFAGRLNPSMHGIYLATDGAAKAICTQCEATDARGIFPCFDEPEFKAELGWAITAPTTELVLANGPLAGCQDDTKNNERTWRFSPTPPVSSYLAALVIGDFEGTEAKVTNEIPLRVFAPRGKLSQTAFALDYTARLLPWYERYFDVKYPYRKYDQVAVPGFDAGAMENVGLVLFRQNLLLMDPGTASWRQEKLIAKVIAHEFAHMWFGNLVTMRWWDDLWLNEAFAEWMAHKAVDAVSDDYKVWDDFQSDKNRALADDALPTTHPIWTPVETPEEAIQMFDSITYQKGCAVMRMLENFLGEAPFREGLRAYMKAYAEKNASGNELWAELERASKQPVSELMHSWISKAGFPILDVTLHEAGGATRIGLHQHKFSSSARLAGTPSEDLWSVPVVLRFEDDEGQKEHRVLFKERATEVTLPAKGKVKWCHANAGEVGFYRVHADQNLRARLFSSGLNKLSASEQMGFLEDHWALVRNGSLGIGEFIDILEAYAKSGPTADHNVLQSVVDRLTAIDRLLQDVGDDAARGRFRSWVAGMFTKDLAALGFDPKEGETQNDRQRRPALVLALGRVAERPEVITESEKISERERSDPASVDPNLAGVCLGVAARFGDAKRYETWLQTYRARKDNGAPPQSVVRYLFTLAEFRGDERTAATLNLIEDGSIPQESIGTMLGQLLSQRHSQGAAWKYLESRWNSLRGRVGDMGLSRLVESLGALSVAHRPEIVRFFENNPPLGAERALARALVHIDEHADLLARSKADLLARFGRS